VKTNSYKIAFGFLIFFTIAFAVFSFDGFYFYDDYAYIYYAQQIVSGTYQIANTDIFAHRWGLILPLALCIKIFGINEWAVCLLPLVATLCSLFLFYVFSKHLPSNSRLYALLFFGLDFYTLFFANKVYPDVLLTTLVLAGLYFLWHRNKHWIVALGFVFFNFWAFLCKELIIYLIPFYLFVLFKDLKNKQNSKFWLVAIAMSIFLLVSYLFVYQIFTENALFRFRAIQDGHYTVGFSYYDKPFTYTLKRITYEPLLMFVNTSVIITLSGAIVLLFFVKKQENHLVFFTAYALGTGLLMFWFMTTNFSAYNPIGLFPRHILFLLPLGAMLTAVALGDKQICTATALLLLLSALWAWRTVGYKTATLYALLGIWLFVKNYFLFAKKTFWDLGLFAILLLHPLYTMLKPTETAYWAEKQIFEKYITQLQTPCIIYTDDKLLTGHRWYFKFKENNSIQFKDFSELEKDQISNLQKYVLINSYSVEYFSQIGYPIPEYVRSIPTNWQIVVENKKVKLYLLNR